MTPHARIAALRLAVTAAASCAAGAAMAAAWSYDGAYGAATLVALPGGQLALARDGADLQARTITYVEETGSTATVITRAYGPSARKAVEVADGTVRHLVYGGVLAPLLHTEGDSKLVYQVGPDTVSVDATGAATVAHRMADIKRSTVAVLDRQALAQQRVAYATLGLAQQQDDGGSAYAEAARLAGYEGLSVLQVGADQLADNRARLYSPAAGRFMALDAAHKARAYEARGNDWITRADYDGRMDELVDALAKDTRIAVAIGEHHDDVDGIVLLMTLLDKLDAKKIGYIVFVESNLLVCQSENGDFFLNDRLEELGLEDRIKTLIKDRSLRLLSIQGNRALSSKEGEEVRRQAKAYDEMSAQKIDKNAVYLAPSRTWDIQSSIDTAEDVNKVAILFMGSGHLQALPEKGEIYYDRQSDGIRYKHDAWRDGRTFLQPVTTFNLVFQHTMVGMMPRHTLSGVPVFDAIKEPHLEKEYSMPMKSWKQPMKYVVFAPTKSADDYPVLKPMFGIPDDDDPDNDEKSDDGDDIDAHGHADHAHEKQGAAAHKGGALEEEKEN